MPLASGTRLGPYEILSALGAGGMGEVYRATDTNLKRRVAIKVLPTAMADDPERLARFQREAEVLAALNHPNIAHIHGLEKADGTLALVMELVEGPTLADRIAQGPIPIAEALPIARQIAEALEAAHEQGIIHRDLKPANIKVREDGTVKVLDFGLAKLTAPEGSAVGGAAMSQSPTLTTPAATMAGVILGTAAYMSPEQARGKTVDKRADIWAFGCVLYEMLTGRPAFEGQSVTETLARVIEREPDLSALPPGTPSSVLRLLRRALTKDPAMRLPDIADARIEIHEATKTEPDAEFAQWRRRSRWKSAIPWAVAALLAVALGTMRLTSRVVTPLAGAVTRLELNLPAGVELTTLAVPSAVLSPDGKQVAFIGNVGGLRRLYLRRLDGFEAVSVPGTETAQTCFFSADGRAVAFISADRALKRVTLADGLVVTLSRDADLSAGGAWSEDGDIAFGRGNALWHVPAAGGEPTQLTKLNRDAKEILHAFPTFVAGGSTLLFTSVSAGGREAHIEAVSRSDGKRKVVIESGTYPLYASSGHLLFFRNAALLAAPFDVDRLAVMGPTVRVLDSLAVDASTGNPLVSVSSSGTLLYPPSGSGTSRLVWVTRQGVEQSITDAPRRFAYPRLEPDGRRIVVYADAGLWIQDSVRATLQLLTSEGTMGFNSAQVWTPDGNQVVSRSRTGLRTIEVGGSGRVQGISGSTEVSDIPGSVSPDGKTLAFVRQSSETGGDIYVVDLRGDSKPRPWLRTPAYEGGAQFSPDGRWMAYASDETGQMQVYLRPFPGPDPKEPVSTQGGTQPVWNRNGKELFYRNGNKMMAVNVSTSPHLVLSQPHQLFEQPYGFFTITIPNYDVSLDGQKFLMVKDESGSNRLNLVLNWTEELKRLAPTK